MGKFVFTRAALRKIVPGLTLEQENQIIDLYLQAVARFKQQINANQKHFKSK